MNQVKAKYLSKMNQLLKLSPKTRALRQEGNLGARQKTQVR